MPASSQATQTSGELSLTMAQFLGARSSGSPPLAGYVHPLQAALAENVRELLSVSELLDLGQEFRIRHQLSDAMRMVFFENVALTPQAQAVDIHSGALGSHAPRNLQR